MKIIKTKIVINATKEQVWEVLTDFEKYPEWNPFIISLCGDMVVNNKIEVKIKPIGSSISTFKPIVHKYTYCKEIVWEGIFILRGIFDGIHTFGLIENNDNTTTFVQSETFRGILIPFFKNIIENQTLKGFELMNEKLKEMVESKSL